MRLHGRQWSFRLASDLGERELTEEAQRDRLSIRLGQGRYRGPQVASRSARRASIAGSCGAHRDRLRVTAADAGSPASVPEPADGSIQPTERR